ncbi:BTAD domain-containing putative transcriptional regulator [Streptomyces sp. NPDC052036]|uniref:AfsR/SARP family transcriptional regulator n=1 Tax=Streptomyces sp. NPDC052036 TaxID=3155171 RepID=UPI00342BFA47
MVSVNEAAPHRVRLELLGGFSLAVGDTRVTVPPASERLLAFVAVSCRGAVPRGLIAGSLWPEAPEHCAYANLRSVLARLRGTGRAALEISPSTVRLAAGVSVDFHRCRALAARVLDSHAHARHRPRFGAHTVLQLSADLLPGWYEDWTLHEAEAWRQMRTHALERLAADFLGARRHPEAILAAHAAVRAEPLRESSRLALIRAHLEEGNASRARREFERYARRLRAETGAGPPDRLRRLLKEQG